MAEEAKPPVPPSPPEGEKKPAAEERAAAPSAEPAKPAAPAKPAGPVPMPWTSPLVEKYKGQYGSGIDAQTYLGQNYFAVDRSLIPDILRLLRDEEQDRKSTRLNSSHVAISYAVFCLKKKNKQ